MIESVDDSNHREDGNESLDTIIVDKSLFPNWKMYVQDTPLRGPWPFVSLMKLEDNQTVGLKKEEDDDDTENPEEEDSDSSYKSKMITLGEADDRETWGGRFDFILSMVGNAVGLGNVWRFPYMAFDNGGGVFLIPYFIMMFVIGISGIMIEAAIGQYSATGTALGFYNVVPLFKGVGLACMINCLFITYFYNAIIAWCYFFFGASFATKVPRSN